MKHHISAGGRPYTLLLCTNITQEESNQTAFLNRTFKKRERERQKLLTESLNIKAISLECLCYSDFTTDNVFLRALCGKITVTVHPALSSVLLVNNAQ